MVIEMATQTGRDMETVGDRGDRGQGYGYGGGSYGGHNGHASQDTVMSPTTAGPTDPNAQAPDYQAHLQWAAYYAANPDQDPYAAYGGYGAMMAQYSTGYTQYYGQGYPAQSSTPGVAGAAGTGPPPPPPSEPAPPASHLLLARLRVDIVRFVDCSLAFQRCLTSRRCHRHLVCNWSKQP